MRTLFSIVVPVYNRRNIVFATIDSILGQSFQDFELIIVDDGSTDNTGTAIQEHYGGNSKIRYYYIQNSERGAARNYGIKQATGIYAVIFDSDDVMHPDYLFTINEKLSLLKGAPINFIATKYQLKEDSGKVHAGGSAGLKEGFYDYKCLLQGNCFGCMYAIRKDNPGLKLFLEDRKYATLEDWIFILDNLKNDRLYLIDKVLISVTHNATRSTADNKRVIKVRGLATQWILENVPLTVPEQEELIAWSHYYCSIHYYLDHNRSLSYSEALQAVKKGGIKVKFLFMLLKSIIGRRLVTMFGTKKMLSVFPMSFVISFMFQY